MPRGRSRRVEPSDDDESDSESEITFTQSQSRSQQRSKSQKSTQDDSRSSAVLREYVTKTVKMVLPYGMSKHPVKRAELTNNAMNGDQRATGQVIAKTKEVLEKIYKMDLVELKEAKTKQFICVATQPALTEEEFTEEQQAEMGLLFLILEYIYMKNGEITDVTLFEYLSRFEIYLDQEHEVFGDVKHLIHDVFTKQHYLNFVKHVAEGSNVEK